MQTKCYWTNILYFTSYTQILKHRLHITRSRNPSCLFRTAFVSCLSLVLCVTTLSQTSLILYTNNNNMTQRHHSKSIQEWHTACRSRPSSSISCLSRVTCCIARLRSNWAWVILTFMLSVACRPHTVTGHHRPHTVTHTGSYQVARKQKNCTLQHAERHNFTQPRNTTLLHELYLTTSQILEYTPTQCLPTRLPHGLVHNDIYITGCLNIHLQGPSCKEVGNRTSQPPTVVNLATSHSCMKLFSQLHECKSTLT